MLDRSGDEQWREAAINASAAPELPSPTGQHNWACFLAEQAAQLAAKGLLHGIGAGDGAHDLARLGQQVEQSLGDPAEEPVKAALRRPARHYIPARYPDAHPSGPPHEYYGREDSDAALADLSSVVSYVDARWATS